MLEPRHLVKLNAANLLNNVDIVCKRRPLAKILAMVKADAYGHGARQIVKTLEQHTHIFGYGVTTVNEAIEIIDCTRKPILIMQGFINEAELAIILRYGLHTVIHSMEQVAIIKQFSTPKYPLIVWLKLETGMHRFGLNLYEAMQAISIFAKSKHIKIKAIMSHYACADEPNAKENLLQTQNYDAAIAQIKAAYPQLSFSTSMDKSSSILTKSNGYDIVRPGLMLYGATSIAGACAKDFGLKPVMQLTAKIIAIKEVKAHDAIGYNATYIAPKDLCIGIVSIGYADGVPKNNTQYTQAVVAGQLVNILGLVSMDALAIDITNLNIKFGDEVTVWGSELNPIEQFAKQAQRSPYDLMTGVGKRIERILVEQALDLNTAVVAFD